MVPVHRLVLQRGHPNVALRSIQSSRCHGSSKGPRSGSFIRTLGLFNVGGETWLYRIIPSAGSTIRRRRHRPGDHPPGIKLLLIMDGVDPSRAPSASNSQWSRDRTSTKRSGAGLSCGHRVADKRRRGLIVIHHEPYQGGYAPPNGNSSRVPNRWLPDRVRHTLATGRCQP